MNETWRRAAGGGVVAIVAGLVYLLNLGEPRAPIWDESYYLTSTQRYLEGRAQFASHPPLALMLIAAGEHITGANAGRDTHTLAIDRSVSGEAIPMGFDFTGVRIGSALAAVIGAVAFYILMLQLSGQTLAALALANLFVFETAFVTQFRAAQLDSFLVAFICLALVCLVSGLKSGAGKAAWADLGFGVFCGLAVMTKANAALLLVVAPLVLIRRSTLAKNLGEGRLSVRLHGPAAMTVGFIYAVASAFLCFLAVAHLPPDTTTSAGQKDAAFISDDYRAYLESGDLTLAGVASAASDYQRFMAADLKGITKTDSNGSSPWMWPIGFGAINYRWDSDGVRTSYIQLVPNFIGWWIGTVAVVATVVMLALSGLYRWRDELRRDLAISILTLFAVFYFAHAVIGESRVMYLYHYFPALIMSWAIVPIAATELCSRFPILRSRIRWIGCGLAGAHLGAFAFFAPLVYHRQLTAPECELRNKFGPVVQCVSDPLSRKKGGAE